MPDESTQYVHAARWRVLNRLYDPIVALATGERRFRERMLARVAADLPADGAAADIGCGTGTFAIALASSRPDAGVTGVDGDAAILDLARGKHGAGAVQWRQGLAGEVPIEDDSLDVVTTSLMLHHLLPAEKSAALAEAARVLKPGGSLHVADWGTPHDPVMSGAFFLTQAIDGFDRTRDHRDGRLPELIGRAGFGAPERYGRFRTAFGSLDLWRSSLTRTA